MDHYQAIDSFFDSFDLPSSLKLLHKTIKTANTKKKWKGIPANALCFGQAGVSPEPVEGWTTCPDERSIFGSKK
jgi:hypothetical protein